MADANRFGTAALVERRGRLQLRVGAIEVEDCKRCSHCKIVKPIKEFGRDKNSSDGLQHQCKKCRNEYAYNRGINRTHRIKYHNLTNGFKVCRSCKEEKPTNEFGKDKTKKDGLRCYCKQCSFQKDWDKRQKLKSGIIKYNEPDSKICSRCRVEKSIFEFSRDLNKKSGHISLCKDCCKEKHNEKPNINHRKNYTCEHGFKICRKCNEKKPLSNFGKSKNNRDGLNNKCKECFKNEYMATPGIEHRKKYNSPIGFKVCSTCEEMKPISYFGEDSRNATRGGDGHKTRCKE